MRLFFLLILSFFGLVLSAQESCTSSTFINHYRFKGAGYGDFTVFANNNSVLMGGRLGEDLLVLSVKEDGDTAWSKKITFPTWTINGLAKAVAVGIANQNNTLLVGYKNSFVRLDSEGNILSFKRMAGKDTITITDMLMAPDGDKVVLFQNGGWEESVVMARLSADLSTVRWVKRIEPNTRWDHIKMWKLALKDDKIGCVGQYNSNGFQGMILSFDYKTGELQNTKSLQFNNRYVSTFDIKTYNDGFVVQGAAEAAGTGTFIVVKLDTALNIRSVNRFTNINRFNYFLIQPQADGSLYGISNEAGFTSILHVTSNGIIDVNTAFALFYFGGRINGIAMNATENYLRLSVAAQSPDLGINNIATYIGLYKSNLNGVVGSCNVAGTPTEYETVVHENVILPDLLLKADSISVFNIPVQSELLPLRIDKLCSAISSCSSLQIVGNSSTCSNEVSLIARKNEQCRLPVKWSVLTGGNATLVNTNDSIVRIHFVKPGIYTIEASLHGSCKYIADTFQINVSAAETLYLGSDTALCTGDSILLKLPGGYNSIKWQNDSDDAEFIIRQSGKYYVTVETFCGALLTDTIIIAQKSSTPITAGQDKVRCNNDTVKLSAPDGFAAYHWWPAYNLAAANSAQAFVYPNVDTTYYVRAQNTQGCYSYDTVQVTIVHTAPVLLGKDTGMCTGSTIVLDAGSGFSSYAWSNGGSSQAITIASGGIYSVKATSFEGCFLRDTINIVIYQKPVVNLQQKAALCSGSSRLLDPGSFTNYRWHNGSTSRTFTATGIGTYFVNVTDINGCTTADTAIISAIIPLPSSFLPADTLMCPYTLFAIEPTRSFSTYLWNSGQTTKSLPVSKQGTYVLSVTDKEGCQGVDSLVVGIKSCTAELRVPTAFTPNNDGINDALKAILYGDVKNFDFRIYNRFGQMVFQALESNKSWDGKFGGIDQNTGTFVWTCHYQLGGSPLKMEKGSVVLIR